MTDKFIKNNIIKKFEDDYFFYVIQYRTIYQQ